MHDTLHDSYTYNQGYREEEAGGQKGPKISVGGPAHNCNVFVFANLCLFVSSQSFECLMKAVIFEYIFEYCYI